MNKNKISIVLLLVSIIVSLINVDNSYSYNKISSNEEKNVLIINSYHRGFKWTDDTVSSFIEKLQYNDKQSKYTFYIEYLDWKKYPTKKNIDNIYVSLKYKYTSKKMDLILATDDKALEIALDIRKDLFKDVPIVFTGLSLDNYNNIIDKNNKITGVLEKIDLTATIKIAKIINPSLDKIYVVHDFTESAISINKEIKSEIERINDKISCISLPPMSIDELMKSVNDLPQDSIILLSTFYRDSQGVIIENSEFGQMISEYSNVPVFSIYDVYIGQGIIGGSVLKGEIQGELAAKLSKDIFNYGYVDAPALEPKSETLVDYNQLFKYNVNLDRLTDITILNKPLTYKESNPQAYYLIHAVIILLVIIISILFYYTKRLLKTKKQLEYKNYELQILNTQIYTSEFELKKIVYYDILTGLANRVSLKNDIENYIKEYRNKKANLIIIDIDNFKYINDTLGHYFGDEFLKSISHIFSDFSSDFINIYRIGGDEFALWITSSLINVEDLAKNIMNVFVNPINIDTIKIHTSLSMGITMYPFAGEDVKDLFTSAEIAMYEAKLRGKQRYVFFDDEMNQRIIMKTKIENNLQFAIENNEFDLYYQPQYCIKTNKISGFEALIRWNNQELGIFPPTDFIKIAEESQKIVAIGKWVFIESCNFALKLKERGYDNVKVSVNISIIQLIQDDFTDFILSTIKEFNLDYKMIELEITESVLIKSVKEAYSKLEILKNMGISISLDDFGTGYSSLSYLQNLPISTLKMDRAFVEDITKNNITKNLANFIISMAHKLNLEVIAEGVETNLQLEILREYDCDKVQGFYYSRALPLEEALELLQKQ